MTSDPDTTADADTKLRGLAAERTQMENHHKKVLGETRDEITHTLNHLVDNGDFDALHIAKLMGTNTKAVTYWLDRKPKDPPRDKQRSASDAELESLGKKLVEQRKQYELDRDNLTGDIKEAVKHAVHDGNWHRPEIARLFGVNRMTVLYWLEERQWNPFRDPDETKKIRREVREARRERYNKSAFLRKVERRRIQDLHDKAVMAADYQRGIELSRIRRERVRAEQSAMHRDNPPERRAELLRRAQEDARAAEQALDEAHESMIQRAEESFADAMRFARPQRSPKTDE